MKVIVNYCTIFLKSVYGILAEGRFEAPPYPNSVYPEKRFIAGHRVEQAPRSSPA